MPTSARRAERKILADYLTRHHLKRSEQREIILDAFLRAGPHVSVEELLRAVHRRNPRIGRTTVYRSLKLFNDAGLASQLLLGGEARFEPKWNREHHDHFVCTECGEITEFSNTEIERIQAEIAASIGFTIEGHRHHVFGRCRKCPAATGGPGAKKRSR